MNVGKNRSRGFTIIEVLIVLAIAGLIILILFLIVPQAKRVQRDNARKHFIDYAAAQMNQFHTDHGYFPKDGTATVGLVDNRCDFIQGYLRSGGTTTCTTDSTKVCTLGDTEQYTICFHDHTNGHHNYCSPARPCPLDEISIMPGHSCNTSAATSSPDYPVKSAGSTDDDMLKFAIWTDLEAGGIYCIDSGF